MALPAGLSGPLGAPLALAVLGALAVATVAAAAWSFGVSRSELGDTRLEASGTAAPMWSDGELGYAVTAPTTSPQGGGALAAEAFVAGGRRVAEFAAPSADFEAAWRRGDGGELAHPEAAALAEHGDVAASVGRIDLASGARTPLEWPSGFMPAQRDGNLVYGTLGGRLAVFDLAQPSGGVVQLPVEAPEGGWLIEAEDGLLLFAAGNAPAAILAVDPQTGESRTLGSVLVAAEAVHADAEDGWLVVAGTGFGSVVHGWRLVGGEAWGETLELPDGATVRDVRTDGERWALWFQTASHVATERSGFAFGGLDGGVDGQHEVAASGPAGVTAAAPAKGIVMFVQDGQLRSARPGQEPLPVAPLAGLGTALALATMVLFTQRYGRRARAMGRGPRCPDCGRPQGGSFGFCLGCGKAA